MSSGIGCWPSPHQDLELLDVKARVGVDGDLLLVALLQFLDAAALLDAARSPIALQQPSCKRDAAVKLLHCTPALS
jgi:hypothetical protein